MQWALNKWEQLKLVQFDDYPQTAHHSKYDVPGR